LLFEALVRKSFSALGSAAHTETTDKTRPTTLRENVKVTLSSPGTFVAPGFSATPAPLSG
jgi:hypothetical protein